MNRNEKADSIETISDSTEGKRQSDTNSVDDGAGKESKNGEGAVQRCVLITIISIGYTGLIVRTRYHIVGQGRIRLSTAPEPAECIEHPRTHETNESDHPQLNPGRRIPGDVNRTHLERFVHPSRWALRLAVRSGNAVGGHDIPHRDFLGRIHIGHFGTPTVVCDWKRCQLEMCNEQQRQLQPSEGTTRDIDSDPGLKCERCGQGCQKRQGPGWPYERKNTRYSKQAKSRLRGKRKHRVATYRDKDCCCCCCYLTFKPWRMSE